MTSYAAKPPTYAFGIAKLVENGILGSEESNVALPFSSKNTVYFMPQFVRLAEGAIINHSPDAVIAFFGCGDFGENLSISLHLKLLATPAKSFNKLEVTGNRADAELATARFSVVYLR